MGVFKNLPLGPPKKTEPAWHPAVQRSFLFVPTAGMRVAPEVLTLELYREVFFAHRSDETSAREIRPASMIERDNIQEPAFDEMEQAVLYATRGRRKQNVQTRIDSYYTPAYPGLARNSWLRRKSDRVIKDFLFRALSQKIHGYGRNAEGKLARAADAIYTALAGSNVPTNPERKHLDIIGLNLDPLKGCVSKEESLNRIRQLLGESSTDIDHSIYSSVFRTNETDDALASRIYDDFLALCELESTLDRLQWLELLKCFLRLVTSVWLLAHMQLTILARDTILAALEGRDSPFESHSLVSAIANRAQNILRPSVTPTTQLLTHTDRYMRARVELNILVAVVEKYCGDNFSTTTITTLRTGSGRLPLEDLITKAKNVSNLVSENLNNLTLRASLTRECEKYKAWVAPRQIGSGQGKNYDEFLRVLRRMTKGDEDGGYLLSQQGAGFVVFPGQLMLKLVAFLSGKSIQNRGLVLGDLEEHFAEYGIDFASSAGARPRLISTLQEIGMLRGSPDAGDSVEIQHPY